ncbi:alpha/beta hydrolase [Alteromonas stellipolaris]|uniref:alpha/beta hydrolase n=1 Tax=Alteromonas stellipolaris TaxID=233316 RepID=UPI0024940C39|nr:alpha/beta hydrolase-fold protein [Alteromonas stellipolaris]
MKKLVAAFLILLFTLPVFADDSISLGTSKSLESKIMAENRPYMVYLPPSYGTSENTYPVIYLLDGDIHRFKGFVGVLESLSTETLGNQVQEAIVIAIPNTNRSRDLTPSSLIEWKFKGRVLETFEQTGNAKQFAKFLENELIPAVDTTYRTSKKRVLVGESFGGLFAANTLIESPSVFTDYLIIDPTSLWDNDYLNRAVNAGNKNIKFNSRVYFAFANNSHLGDIGLTNYEWGSTFASSVIDNNDAISEQQFFENETHGTVAFLAWYNGLKTLMPTTEY